MLSAAGEIRRDEGCMDYAGQFLMIYGCHSMKGNQEWILGVVSISRLCSSLRVKACLYKTNKPCKCWLLMLPSQQTQNNCITFVQRLRRWSNIVQMLPKCLVFIAIMCFLVKL